MDDSPSQPRVKRQKIDKKGRFAALAKLKSLKGQKNKYEVNEDVDRVYDIVDESEFAKRAREKYGDDWIEDDGTGYLEDGRDFFEDEDDYSDDASNNKSKRKDSQKRKRDDTPVKGKGSIRSLFSNAVPKKKEAEAKLEEDDVLADILGELDEDKQKTTSTSSLKLDGCSNVSNGVSSKSEAAMVKEYMNNFISFIKKKDEPKKSKEDTSDDEMIDRILKPKKETVVNHNPASKPIEEISAHVPQVADEEPKPDEKDEPMEFTEILPEPSEPQITINSEDIKKAPAEEVAKENYNDMDLSMFNDNEHEFNVEDEEQSSQLETQTLNEIGTLKMWYWDAWEDAVKRPGQIFLFGKVKDKNGTYKSTSVRLDNVERTLFLLPREYLLDPITKQKTKTKVTFLDVYNEFNDKISVDLGLDTFRSKKVTKNFAFHVPGVDVPEICDYLEVRYEGKKPVPRLSNIYDSIAHIFGTTTPALETFLLDRKIKGPCWLNITDFEKSSLPISWCKLEIVCQSPNSIKVADEQNNSPPPAIVLSINVRTALNPKTMINEVVMMSCLVNNKFRVDKPPTNPPFSRHFCGFTRPNVQNWPLDLNTKLQQYKMTKTTKLDTERALLSWFLATYQSIDPDLIVTHDANDCKLDAICDRITALKIPLWSRLGRLKRTQITGKKYNDFFIGRMICDVKQSAEELIKSKSYDLETLCVNVLKMNEGQRTEVNNNDLYSMYESGEGVLKLITLTMQDCSYILKLMCELNVLPLALQITNICGNLISRTLQGGRSLRNEFLLLHAFTEKNYIVPDKKVKEWGNPDGSSQITSTAPARKKAAYSGGLVLEPIKGFYDKYILLMDFNSLYPSIIQEYNICFTTISPPTTENEMPDLPDPNSEQGVLPRQIRRLVESRREVKKLMANPDLDPDLKMQYNIRQLALKLTANSMYGCLGFAQSRFFAQHLAALVTFKGREILTNTKSWVQKLNYEVIYGDTDSIMINTNCVEYDQVFKIGHSIKQTINKTYRQIELDVDGVFKCLLLLKKKKYAAITITKDKKGELIETHEYKGLDIVRRDWSQISVMAGKLILKEILSENQLDEKIESIHAHLEKFKQNILDGSVPLPMLTITKQLTKNPKDYTAINTLPHVQVALRMNSTRNKRYKRGDMVSYIICDDGTENPAMQRAYHLDELKSDEKLKVDTIYYLAQQIHPVVSRLCEPLEGTDASRIAGCLGLDPSKFKVAAQKVHNERLEESAGESLIKSNAQKYRQCEKFFFTCVTCKTRNLVASAFKPVDKTFVPVLLKCSNSECNSAPYQYVISIRNELVLSMRSFVRRFYENWMVCDDPTCNNNTRIYSYVNINNKLVCLACKQGSLIRQFSERDLYHQLSYFQYMFDLSKYEKKDASLSIEVEQAYNILKETVNQHQERSEFCTIRLGKVFAKLTPKALENRSGIPSTHT